MAEHTTPIREEEIESQSEKDDDLILHGQSVTSTSASTSSKAAKRKTSSGKKRATPAKAAVEEPVDTDERAVVPIEWDTDFFFEKYYEPVRSAYQGYTTQTSPRIGQKLSDSNTA